jgi:hypothetical protein
MERKLKASCARTIGHDPNYNGGNLGRPSGRDEKDK